MAYDGKLLSRAREHLDGIRNENQAEQQRRLNLIYSRIPEIQSLDYRMRGQMAELVRLTISKVPDLKERVAQLQDSNLSMQMRKAELLVSGGYPMDYLDDIYSCPACQDTGIDNGHVCQCLEKLYNMELTKELGTLLKSGDESFEHFDLKLYSDVSDPVSGVVPREAMSVVFDSCKKFADLFPEVQTNLLFQGGTGLGKTYLSACIARVVAKKGLSVCYDSAAVALEAFERHKFARDPEEAEVAGVRVRRMLECDLMILDDLGTEMLTSMSSSALYTLINTRLVSRKRMIISTNLDNETLGSRYTPQICSRIAGEFLCLPFVGKDIRLIKKGV